MNKRVLSSFLTLCLVTGTNVNITAYGEIIDNNREVAVNKEINLQNESSSEDQLNQALEKLRSYYSEEELEYLEAMAYRHSGNDMESDLEIIQSKIKRPYNTKGIYNRFKGVMAAVAANEDPTSFKLNNNEKANIIELLLELQNKEDGAFNASIGTHLKAVIAADMANGDYDIAKAVQYIINKLKFEDDKAYIDEYGKQLNYTALAMIVLSNHTDLDGVEDIITKCINYIKSQQKDYVGFQYNPQTEVVGNVIQALIAVGENPLSSEYVKDDKTLLTELLKAQLEDGTFKADGGKWSGNYTNDDATVVAFAALADLYKGKSMYKGFHEGGSKPSKPTEVTTPSAIQIIHPDKNELIMGETLQLKAKVFDIDGDEVTGQSIRWGVDNEGIAKIVNSNELDTSSTTGGSIRVTAVLEVDESITDDMNIKVLRTTSMEILLDGEVVTDPLTAKVGIDTDLTIEIKDQDNEVIDSAEAVWTVSEGDCVTVDDGKVSAKSEGTAKIKAEYKGLQAEITINVEKIKPEDVLELVKSEIKSESKYNYTQALTLSFLEEDKTELVNKISVDKSGRYSKDYAKNIIMINAAGLDPKNYDGKDYVSDLVKSQHEDGYFNIYGYPYYEDKADSIAYSIIALDMVEAEYKVDEAVQALLKKFTVDSKKAYIKNYSKVDFEKSIISIIALSNHTDIDGVDSIVEGFKNFLKEEQSEKGYFTKSDWSGEKPSCTITANVIEALYVIGEDPLSDDWSKVVDGKKVTLLDALLTFNYGNEIKENEDSSSYYNKPAKDAAFAALAAINKGMSAYQHFGIGVKRDQTPTSIEVTLDGNTVTSPIDIKMGKVKELKAEVKDQDGDKIRKAEVTWNLLEGDCVSLENGTLTTLKEGTARIKAVYEGVESSEITINVQAVKINSLQIELDNNSELIMGEKLQLKAKALDSDGEEVAGQSIKWSVDNEYIAKIVNSNELDTSATIGGTVKATAVLEGNESISAEIEIKVLKPTSINILIDEKEVTDPLTVKVGIDTDLTAQIKDQDNQIIERAEAVWTVSEGDCVTVDNGKVSASSEGTAKVKVEYKGLQAEITINAEKIKPEDVIDLLKSQVMSEDEYNYIQALTLNYVGEDKSNIAGKIAFDKSPSTPIDCAEDIIMLIGAGCNPYDYEGNNYVKQLVDKQDLSEGYFDKNLKLNFEYLVMPIIALDMAAAEYDKDKAVNYMKDTFFKVDESKAYIKQSMYSDDHDFGRTIMALIALSNHRDIEGVNDLIEGCKKYIKEQQNEKGYFEKVEFEYDWMTDETTETREPSCSLTANAVQALYAVGEDPLSDQWTKTAEGKKITLLDALLSFRYGSEFKENQYSYDNDGARDAAFAALADISKGKSVYKKLKYGAEGPSKIEITNTNFDVKRGNTLQLTARVLDSEGEEIPNTKLVWSSNDPSIAEVENGLVKGVKVGKATITVKVEGDEAVTSSVEINITEALASEVSIGFPMAITELEMNNPIKLDVLVKDAKGDKLESQEIEWKLNLEGADIDENGVLKCTEKGTLEITAKVKGTEIKSNTLTIEVIEKQDVHSEIIKILKDVKKDYLKQEEFSYFEALALNFAGVNKNIIANKKLEVFPELDALHCRAKSIMSIKAAGKDPKNYNGENYIDKLLKPEDSNYEFYNETNVKSIAMSILALDMVQADYKKEEAVKALIKKAYVTDTMAYYGEGPEYDVSTTAVVMTAMAAHRDIEGVNEFIEKCKVHLKSVQLQNAGFKNSLGYESSVDSSEVVQALIAVGENPLTYKWSKIDNNGKKVTILDAILDFRDENQFKGNKDDVEGDKTATSLGFGALLELKFNKSMYQNIGINEIEPSKIQIISPSSTGEMYIDGSLQLTAKVFDDIDNEIFNKEILWESNDVNIAEVDENGLITGKAKGTAVITAKLKENNEVQETYTVDVKKAGSNDDIIISRIGNESLKNGRGGNFKLNVKNNSSDEWEITIAAVVYDKDTNEIVKCSYVTKTIEADINEIINVGCNIPKEGNYVVKAFVCKNVGQIEPYKEPAVVIDVEK